MRREKMPGKFSSDCKYTHASVAVDLSVCLSFVQGCTLSAESSARVEDK